MKASTKILNSLLIASGATLVDFLHKKIGGLLFGGNYSDSHTWEEMIEIVPELIGVFVLFFMMSLLYFFIMRREVLLVCPKCGDKFSTTNPSEAYCVECAEDMGK